MRYKTARAVLGLLRGKLLGRFIESSIGSNRNILKINKHIRYSVGMLLGMLFGFSVTAQGQATLIKNDTINLKNKRMKIEIWSDVMCPFCYIGKRKFETALEKFAHKDEVEIVWKSYQLNPNMVDEPNKDVYTYLAEVKGQTKEWSVKMHASVAASAAEVGLNYNFDIAKVANSFDAHRLVQLAKKHGKGGAMEERLFKAYFTEGAVISDAGTLTKLAVEIGLEETEVKQVLASDAYANEVRFDIYEAQQLGCSGVPFFVFDRKMAVPGAVDAKVFSEVLDEAYEEWVKSNPNLKLTQKDGAVCTPEGECK
jgi:predicted DsbA family dithiol-disulfide isomerase